MLRLHTAPTVLPVSLSEAKLHMNVTLSSDDDLILSLIAAATGEAEHLMGRAIMPQKWQVMLDAFADEIDLDRPPVTAIDSIQYAHATTGDMITLDASASQLSVNDYGAVVVPAWGVTWPSTRAQRDAVRIVFSCGYADAASVPELIKGWIRLQATTSYNTRSSVRTGRDSAAEKMPDVDRMLDRYKVWKL